jgi:nucleolin
MFESYGEITRLDWKNDKDTGKFMGYGYLSFTTDEAAEKVIAELNGKVIAGRPLRIDYSSGTRAGAGAGGRGGSGGDFGGGRSRERSSPAETIFVGNLPTDVTGEEISETFGNCGNIVDIRYVNDRETGEFKRCAFVEFEDEASAARVFEDSRSIRDCSLRLDYASKKT